MSSSVGRGKGHRALECSTGAIHWENTGIVSPNARNRRNLGCSRLAKKTTIFQGDTCTVHALWRSQIGTYLPFSHPFV